MFGAGIELLDYVRQSTGLLPQRVHDRHEILVFDTLQYIYQVQGQPLPEDDDRGDYKNRSMPASRESRTPPCGQFLGTLL